MEATNLAELDDAMRHRMEMYALLARLYREEVDGDLLRMLQEGGVTVSGDASLDEGLYLMRRYLASFDASTLDLAKDYAKVFCGAASTNKTAAYPYESVFTSEKGLLMQEARDEVLAWYHRYGLGRSERYHECEDHVALEFEFFAFLIGKYLDASASGQAASAEQLLAAQRDFMQGHLVNWVPAFCRHVNLRAKTDFYRGLAQLTAAYVKRDFAALKETAGAFASAERC